MTDREAYVAFNLTENIGSVGVGELAAKFGGVAAAWEAYPRKTARNGGIVDGRGEFEKARRFGVSILTPCDADYPERLRATRGHPLVLYVKGDVTALSKPSVAVVGTRRATVYGCEQARRFGHELAARGWMILSGLALGIDAEAHRGALDAGGVTVGVLGSGLDVFYPAQNRELAREIVKKGGAVVSAFPFGRPPDQQTFPQRNHVVAALADGVLAVEAPVKSGTLITAGFAADLGRSVMVVPCRVDSGAGAGGLALIRQGATLVRCPDDVDEELRGAAGGAARRAAGDAREGTSAAVAGARSVVRVTHAHDAPGGTAARAREDTRMTGDEARVLKVLDEEGVSMDALVGKSGLPAGTVAATCMALRLRGLVRFLPGNRVAAARCKLELDSN